MNIRTYNREFNGKTISVCLYKDKAGNDGQIVKYLSPSLEVEKMFILINGDVVRKANGPVSDKKAHNCVMRLMLKLQR